MLTKQYELSWLLKSLGKVQLLEHQRLLILLKRSTASRCSGEVAARLPELAQRTIVAEEVLSHRSWSHRKCRPSPDMVGSEFPSFLHHWTLLSSSWLPCPYLPRLPWEKTASLQRQRVINKCARRNIQGTLFPYSPWYIMLKIIMIT